MLEGKLEMCQFRKSRHMMQQGTYLAKASVNVGDVGNGIHFCDTTERASKHIQGEIPKSITMGINPRVIAQHWSGYGSTLDHQNTTGLVGNSF